MHEITISINALLNIISISYTLIYSQIILKDFFEKNLDIQNSEFLLGSIKLIFDLLIFLFQEHYAQIGSHHTENLVKVTVYFIKEIIEKNKSEVMLMNMRSKNTQQMQLRDIDKNILEQGFYSMFAICYVVYKTIPNNNKMIKITESIINQVFN